MEKINNNEINNMKSNRRNFFGKIGALGVGLFALNMLPFKAFSGNKGGSKVNSKLSVSIHPDAVMRQKGDR